MNINEVESLFTNKDIKSDMNSENNSLIIAVISWLKIVWGLGAFTIPYFYSIYGWSLGIFITIISCLITYNSVYVIFNISKYTKINNYSELIKKYLGEKMMIIYTVSTIIDISISFMICIIIAWRIFCILTIKSNMINFEMIGMYIDEYYYNNYIIRIIFISIISLICTPLLLFKNLKKWKFVSSFYLLILIYLLLVIFLETPYFYNENKRKKEYTLELKYKSYSFEMITGFFSLILSFYNQPWLFEIKNDLINPTFKRINKVSKISLLILCLFFILIGTLGYLSLGDNLMNELIILRNPYSKNKNEILMNVGLFLFLISLIISLPTFNPSLRNLISESFNIDITNKKNYILVSLIPYYLCAILSIIYPDILTVFGYIGATFCNFNGFFIIYLLDIVIIKNSLGKVRNFLMKICLLISTFLFLFYIIMLYN